MRGSLDRIKTCSMLPLWILSQTKRLVLNVNSFKEFKATEDWEINKGKESGIIYEYDCIKSFVETTSFNKFSAKFGLILNSLLISSNLLLHILICLRRIDQAS